MITKTTGYQTSDGTVHATLESAQKNEIAKILAEETWEVPSSIDVAAKAIIENQSRVIDILTTGPKSRPKSRAVNGAKRGKKKRHEAEQFSLPLPTEETAQA